MSFLKKRDALDYQKTNQIKYPCLFAEDKSSNGSKKFHVTPAKNIFNNMLTNSDNHMYEFWAHNQPIAFALDIDIEDTTNSVDGEQVVRDRIKNVIKGAKKFYKHNYRIEDIIVLENHRLLQQKENPNKQSYHVICRGLTFENHLVAKDFFLRLDAKYDMKYCDRSIYNLTCLRLCFNSKKGKTAIAVPMKLMIDGEKTSYPASGSKKVLYEFWLSTLVTYVSEDDPVIKKSAIVNKPSTLRPTVDVNNNPNIDIEHVIFQLPPEYHNNYDTWIRMGMILKNTGEEYFELWKRWSKQSPKYDESKIDKVWKGFKDNVSSDSKLTLGTLIKWCNECGIVNIFKNKKLSIKEHVSSYPIKPIQLNLDTGETPLILNQAKLEPSVFMPYMDKRMIAVQSEKGTGKTTNLLKVLFDSKVINKDTSVLFVSSRRTFAIKLSGDLKSEKFYLYSDIKEQYINKKRIICQIDSLMRLDREKYDVVVIDESESLARYMTSSHFTKNPRANIIIGALKMRVRTADHVYILDADLSDRCLNFYKNTMHLDKKDYQLIVNQFKPYQAYTFVCMSYDEWLVKVVKEVNDNKRIVVPMASNSKAKDLYTKLTNDFPAKNILLIHKETSDDDKLEKLVNVNTTWNKYDVIIYTPSVCMGVSFDIHGHFDSIYAYGCHMSLGAQEFCQMIHRVRSPVNKKIYISMDYYKEYNEADDRVTYGEVEELMCSDHYLTHYDIHNNNIPKDVSKIVENGHVGRDVVLMYPYKDDPIYDMYVRNNWEIIENKLNFTASFFGYAKFKQYQIEFEHIEKDDALIKEIKDIHQQRINEQNEKNVAGIMEAPDLTHDEYLQKVKTRDEYLSEGDVYAIQRYNLKKCYGLEAEHISQDFVKTFHDREKMKWYRNLSTITKTATMTSQQKLDMLKKSRVNNLALTNCFMDFMVKNQYGYHFYAHKVLDMLEVDISEPKKDIGSEVMQKTVDEFWSWAEAYKKDIAFKFDLNIRNRSLKDMTKAVKVKCMNTILRSMYGVKFEKGKTAYNLKGFEVWDTLPRETKIIPVEMDTAEEFDFIDFEDGTNEVDSTNDNIDLTELDAGIEEVD